MTPEERAQFEARSQAVTPGRKADRERTRQNREARALIERLARADRENETNPTRSGSTLELPPGRPGVDPTPGPQSAAPLRNSITRS